MKTSDLVATYYRSEELPPIRATYEAMLKCIRSEIKPQDQEHLDKAFQLALEAHGPQRRKSGEPYIYHPIEVARICAAELSLGPTAIVAALLHDVVEDTSVSLEDLRLMFSDKIAMIVDGLTKIEAITNTQEEKSSPQAENFKKILLTISKDVRVVLIKMADRLHNMRTLDSMSEIKQKKIASETSFIFAPLAHRLGFYKIKTELEDLAYRYYNGSDYHFIVQKLQETKAERETYVNSFIEPIKEAIAKENMDCRIFGRSKSVSSIANKLSKKKIPFEEIYDLFAVRVILKVPKEREKSACWHVYSIITDHYTPVPERLKDWISTPKSNGYESLHTTVMGPKGRFVEVQIRSERMDEVAELGFAAHWKYKGVNAQEGLFENWLNKARELLENPSNDAIDFLNDFKSNLFAEEVYVFTPAGDLKIFPKGATALDFAFDIHSEVGYRCKAVKVAQKIVPLDYQLRNGDQLEVIQQNNQKPTEDWLKIVKTGKARSKIRQALREEEMKMSRLGRESFERKLKGWKIPLNEANIDAFVKTFGAQSRMDFFCKVYEEKYNLSEYKQSLQLDSQTGTLQELEKQIGHKAKEENQDFVPKISPLVQSHLNNKMAFKGKPKLMIDNEDASIYAHELAACCNPIPGDDIFAYITSQNIMRIHRSLCNNAEHLHATYGYRIRSARWVDSCDGEFDAELLINGFDNLGVVQRLSDIITNQKKANMKSFSMTGENGHFEGRIKVVVHNKQQLDEIIQAINELEEVQLVTRTA